MCKALSLTESHSPPREKICYCSVFPPMIPQISNFPLEKMWRGLRKRHQVSLSPPPPPLRLLQLYSQQLQNQQMFFWSGLLPVKVYVTKKICQLQATLTFIVAWQMPASSVRKVHMSQQIMGMPEDQMHASVLMNTYTGSRFRLSQTWVYWGQYCEKKVQKLIVVAIGHNNPAPVTPFVSRQG